MYNEKQTNNGLPLFLTFSYQQKNSTLQNKRISTNVVHEKLDKTLMPYIKK
jgi:hypothetical protein